MKKQIILLFAITFMMQLNLQGQSESVAIWALEKYSIDEATNTFAFVIHEEVECLIVFTGDSFLLPACGSIPEIRLAGGQVSHDSISNSKTMQCTRGEEQWTSYVNNLFTEAAFVSKKDSIIYHMVVTEYEERYYEDEDLEVEGGNELGSIEDDEEVVIYMYVEEVHDSVEISPQFYYKDITNTIDAINAYVADHKQIRARKRPRGTVEIQCIIEKNGSLSELEVLHSVSRKLDAEALRIISSMPSWNPGKYRGRPARVKYVIPIAF